MQKEVHNKKFPKLSSRVRYLKEEEGGVSVMCEVMEQYMNEAKEAGIKEGKEAGIREGKAAEKKQIICRMIQKGFEKEVIIDLGYTESEYEEAEKSLLASV